MSSAEEQAETTPTAAILSLPRFSTAAVTAWFQRAEVQFRLKKVVQSWTKADHVLASIPEEVFPRLSDWLEEKGDHLQYEELKEAPSTVHLDAGEKGEQTPRHGTHALG